METNVICMKCGEKNLSTRISVLDGILKDAVILRIMAYHFNCPQKDDGYEATLTVHKFRFDKVKFGPFSFQSQQPATIKSESESTNS